MLDQVKNFSLSNISDAFNNVVSVVKSQPTYIQAIVGAVAIAAIGLVGTALYYLAQKVFNWNEKPAVVAIDPAQVEQAKTANTAAQTIEDEISHVAKEAENAFNSATNDVNKEVKTAKDKVAQIAAKANLAIAAPVKEAVDEAAGKIKALGAVIKAEFKNLTDSETEIADATKTASEVAAATAKQKTAVTVILEKNEEINKVNEEFVSKKAKLEEDKNELATAKAQISAENLTFSNKENVYKGVAYTGVAIVGTAILAGLTLPFAIPAAAITYAGAAGVVGGAAGLANLVLEHTKNAKNAAPASVTK